MSYQEIPIMTATTHPGRERLWRRLSPVHRTKLVFLAAGLISLVLSVILWFGVDRELGLFVGLWVPTVHSLGALVVAGEGDRR
jgi:hypothetical protein